MKTSNLELNYIKLNTKLFFNASYNAYRNENDCDSLYYAVRGIELCMYHQVYDSYPHLLLRKCVAEAYLKKEVYRDTREDCYHFLTSTGQHEKLITFKKVLDSVSI
jgi:hypothetical protein